MKSLAEFLEREGGLIALLAFFVVLFAIMAVFSCNNVPFFDKIALAGFSGSLGALLMAMKGGRPLPPDFTQSTQTTTTQTTDAKP